MDRLRFISSSDLTSAATVVMTIRPVAMCLPTQRRFIAGPTTGAVKGR
ncbi:hypothetical protein KXR53_24150 [Inquilinus limosus]